MSREITSGTSNSRVRTKTSYSTMESIRNSCISCPDQLLDMSTVHGRVVASPEALKSYFSTPSNQFAVIHKFVFQSMNTVAIATVLTEAWWISCTVIICYLILIKLVVLSIFCPRIIYRKQTKSEQALTVNSAPIILSSTKLNSISFKKWKYDMIRPDIIFVNGDGSRRYGFKQTIMRIFRESSQTFSALTRASRQL